MHISNIGLFRRSVALMLVVSMVALTSGCATLAHRSSAGGQRERSTVDCNGEGDVCPWLLGDAGLLLLGVVPGVIAFIVDFSTGAYQHSNLAQALPRPDKVATTSLLFTPDRTRPDNTGPVPVPARSPKVNQETGRSADAGQPASAEPYHPLRFANHSADRETP